MPLPNKRRCTTFAIKIANKHHVFITVGEDSTGTPIELFLAYDLEDTTLRGLLDAISILVSYLLQAGFPLERIVEKFIFTKFEPAGSIQGHPNLKWCTSPLDAIFRLIAIEYLGRYDLAQVKPEEFPCATS
jgi:ribonucleoside-diphosphate reductase alpha chain